MAVLLFTPSIVFASFLASMYVAYLVRLRQVHRAFMGKRMIFRCEQLDFWFMAKQPVHQRSKDIGTLQAILLCRLAERGSMCRPPQGTATKEADPPVKSGAEGQKAGSLKAKPVSKAAQHLQANLLVLLRTCCVQELLEPLLQGVHQCMVQSALVLRHSAS